MKLSCLLVLAVPLLCATQETAIPPCDWRFLLATEGDGADTSQGYLPPQTTQCHLFFSDTLTLVNTGSADRSIFRLSSAAAFASCDTSQLFPGVPSVSAPAGGAYSLTLSRGSSNPWDFLLLDSVYLVSPGEGGCLRIAFFVSSDSSRDCSIGHGGGACYASFHQTQTTTTTTTTNSTTTTTTTTTTAAATTTSSFNVRTERNNEVSFYSNQTCEDSCIPYIPGHNITFQNNDTVARHVYLLRNFPGALECNITLAEAGNLTLPPNSSVSFSLGLDGPWMINVSQTMFLLVTSRSPLCSCQRITVTPFSCTGTNTPDGSVMFLYFVSALGALIVVTVLAVGMCVTMAYLTEKRRKKKHFIESKPVPHNNNNNNKLEFVLD